MGKEFCDHELSRGGPQRRRVYFAHPYASWGTRPQRKQPNGLVRQYFPKKFPFAGIKDKDLQQVEDFLNNRPRKDTWLPTPNEVFFKTTIRALPS
jgi:IS30 family transposase